MIRVSSTNSAASTANRTKDSFPRLGKAGMASRTTASCATAGTRPKMVLLTFATPSSSIQSKHRKPSVERPRLGARMRAELEKLSWDRTNEDFARAWRFSTGRLDRINDRTDCITLLLNNTSSFLLHHRTSEHLFSFIIPDRELCVSRRRRRAARPPWGDRVASRQRWVDES